MDATDRTDRSLTSTLLLSGAALALLGNALHPFFAADATASEVIEEAASSSLWVPLHLGLAIAIALLSVAVVLVARGFIGTAGETLGRVASAGALIGGTTFIVQIGAIDGYVFPALADQGAAGSEAAAALWALDGGLLSLVVMGYFGATFLAFGLAMHRAEAFAPWIRWTAIASGAAGIVVGTMMFLDTGMTFALLAFRVVALGTTAVALGLGLALRRAPAASSRTAPAAA